jgi:hypothetical protein
MQAYSESAQNRIFDSILTEALKENYRREAAFFKEGNEHTFSEEFEKGIAVIGKRLKRKQNAAKLRKSAPKLVTAATVIIVCMALATNPSVHAFIRDIVVRITDGFSQHEFNDDVEITHENFNHELRPEYLPDGYRILFAHYGMNTVIIDFINERENIEDDTFATMEYRIADGSVISIDIENTNQFKVLVNGREAIFYETTTEDRTGYLIWNRGGYAFMLTAQLELHEFVQIAESIKIS